MNDPVRRSSSLSLSTAVWLAVFFACKILRSTAPSVVAPAMQYALYPAGLLLAAFYLRTKEIRPADRLFAPVFSLWFVLACTLRSGSFRMDDAVSGAIIFLYCGTVYWFGCGLARTSFHKYAVPVLHCVCAATAATFLIPILTAAVQVAAAEDPAPLSSLFADGRLSLLNEHPNTIGSLSSVGILLCAYLFLRGHGPVRAIPVAEGIFFFLCLALTDSKQNQFGLSICAGAAVFFSIAGGSRPRALRITAAVLALFAAAALTYGAIHLTAKAASGLPAAISRASAPVDAGSPASEAGPAAAAPRAESTAGQANASAGSDGSAGSKQAIKVRSAGDFHTLGSRMRLWKHWLSLLKKYPTAWLYGTDAVPQNMKEAGYSAHNAFIVLLVCFGLPALLMMLLFLVRLLGPSLCICLTADSRECRVFPICCLMLLMNACMESDFFYSVSAESFLFFLLAGLTVGARSALQEEKLP